MKLSGTILALMLTLAGRGEASEINMEIAAPNRRAPATLPYDREYAEAVSPETGKSGGTLGTALGSASSVDVQRRGAPGAQGDISIRGSSFQQNLVLLDGIRMNDPQTAHHNLDLPLTVYDVERVDVLSGPYSSVYGPDAYAGAVNLLTKRPDKDRVSARLTFAEFASWSALASCDRKWKKFGQRLTLEKGGSGGFRRGTDHRSENLFSRSTLDLPGGEVNLSIGYLDKDFGASHFYGTVLRDEREHTKTRFISLAPRFGSEDSITVEPKAYFRRHDDKFSYLYNSVHYANRHVTDVSGGELRLGAKLGGLGQLSAGGEYTGEKIESSNIGGHGTVRKAVFGRYAVKLPAGLDLDASVRNDRHSSWGWQTSPGLRLGLALTPEAKLWAAAGKSFRAPSFTELYYRDPSNIGNSALKPEKSVSYETGLDWKPSDTFRLRAAAHRRNETDLLDWTRPGTSGPWTANNIGKVKAWGFEETIEGSLGALSASLKYAYLYKDSPGNPYLSKYSMRYARHKAGLGLKYRLPREAGIALNLSGIRRVKEKGYVLVDTEFSKKYGNFEAAAGVTNLLDADYEEIPGAGAPGRWLKFSLSCSFS